MFSIFMAFLMLRFISDSRRKGDLYHIRGRLHMSLWLG